MDAKEILRDMSKRMSRLRYYPDKRHMMVIGEIYGRLRAIRNEFSIKGDESDHEWLTLIEATTSSTWHTPRVTIIKRLGKAIEAYLDDPDHSPGPDQVREALSPRYDPGSGIDCCTQATA